MLGVVLTRFYLSQGKTFLPDLRGIFTDPAYSGYEHLEIDKAFSRSCFFPLLHFIGAIFGSLSVYSALMSNRRRIY